MKKKREKEREKKSKERKKRKRMHWINMIWSLSCLSPYTKWLDWRLHIIESKVEFMSLHNHILKGNIALIVLGTV